MKRQFIGIPLLVLILTACGAAQTDVPPDVPVTIVTPEPTPLPEGVVPTVAIGVTPEGFEPPPGASPTDAVVVDDFDPFAAQQPRAATGYVIPPTVQHVTDTAAQILFQFEEHEPGVIFYRPVGGGLEALQMKLLDPSEDRHFITLEGLEPSSTYEFVVRIGDGPPDTLQAVPFEGSEWKAQTFRTPPFGEPLRFTVIGDSGFGEPVTYSLAQLMAEFDPHFVLHVGDMVYWSDRNADPIEAYHFKYYGPMLSVLNRAPLYPSLGNHDLNDPDIIFWDRPFYFWAFPPIEDTAFPASAFDGRRKWYAFAANGVQFLSLDTQTFFGDSGREEQLAWLEERLADARFDYSVAFFHVPPYSSGSHFEESAAVRPLAQMLEEANVPLVFSGHDHDYERLPVGPTTYVVTGGGSAGLYDLVEAHPNSEVFESRSHFMAVEVFSDTINVRAVGVNGEAFDEFSLSVP